MSIAVGLLLLCFVVLAVWTTWFRQKPDAPPMMPGSLPIIGHSHLIIGDRKHLWRFIQNITLTSLKYGGAIELWFGFKRHYVLSDPDDCLTVANTCYNKPYVYDFGKEFIKDGLVTAEASIWKTNRKLLHPAFNQQVVDTFIEEINIQARNLVSNVKNELGKESFDIHHYLISFTLSTVSRTSLGLTGEDQKIIDRDYAAAIDATLASYCERFQKVWLHSDFLFKWSEIKRKQDKLKKTLHNIIFPVILQRKSELTTKKEPTYYEEKPGKFKPILDQMLQMASDHGVFTDEDIREHLDTFVIASYDTTSSAMNFMLLLIASYPETQNRIYNEIQEVLQNKDDDFSKHDLQKLVYLEAVIKESMRLYASGPILGRNIDEDIKLKNCTLRANSICIFGVHALHRHPLWGPDANEFKPERWLDPSRLPDNPTLFAAFGIGKRNCIGKKFGILMMKIALAHIIRQYHISGDIQNLQCEFGVILKPVSGHHVGLKLRS